MIPLKSDIKTKSIPIVNWLIIVLNAYVFYIELHLGQQSKALERFVWHWGVDPVHLLAHPRTYWYTLVSAMFIHGGWMHIIFNMLFLFIFGKSVEDATGHFRYLYFYLITGVVANAAQAYFSAGSSIPLIGASGAIAGILGAYFFYYPHSKILTAIPILFFITVREIPAFIFLGLWFIIQAFSGTMSMHMTQLHASGGVAWWAHTIGFVSGLLLAPAFGRAHRGDH